MSRGVRDLRDLICVSRLTFRESEEDEVFSDDGADRKFSNEIRSLSLSSDRSDSKLESPRVGPLSARIVSPDSGFITNGSPGISSSNVLTASSDSLANGDNVFITGMNSTSSSPKEPASSGAKFVKSQKKKRKRKPALPLEPTRHDLPRASPLPPVQRISGSGTVSEHELQQAKPSYERVQSAQASRGNARVNFDDMLTYMDATIVADWLTRSNTFIQELSKYCNKGDNFVQFAHFWLSDFPDIQKRDIFSMEYDILLDEITLAFAVGRENRKIVRRDILDMCGAVFREYPVKLLSAKGSHIFLDYLDILSSEKHEQYKKLLSDVRCSTSNRQYAQWLLATRSFALVNVWISVVNFFRNLNSEGTAHGMPILDLCSSKESIPHRRMLQAIRLGYVDVIHYLIINGHVNPTYSDSHRRSLLFTAVMHNQLEVVKYLLTKVHPVIEINQPADTGNTALHAASNSGNLAVVELLCECEKVDVNCINPQCENATPLHLAVMHGHEKIVECLLKHGADPLLKMGDTTVTALATDFDHKEILDLLEENQRS